MSVINCTVSTGDETTLNSREWLIRIVVGPLAAFMTIMSLMRCALKCPVSCQCKKTVVEADHSVVDTGNVEDDDSDDADADAEDENDDDDVIQCRSLPTLPTTSSASDVDVTAAARCDNTMYAVIDEDGEQDRVRRSSSPVPLPSPDLITLPITFTDCLQSFSGSSVYAVPCLFPPDYTYVEEIPRECLLFVEKLGEGSDGEVCLCEALLSDDDDTDSEHSDGGVLVVVRSLHTDADANARTNFYRELSALSSLRHENIVRLVGLCTAAEPLCIITEYLQHGDLKQFLQHRQYSDHLSSQQSISYGALMYMATQVASGMQYLESLGMIHRDLAARNCLVGHQYVVKISDFAMSRLLFNDDYYVVGGQKRLPLRWMAWESVILGKFSTKTDAWSFAVTLWEILTLCRWQPYSELDDSQVIANCQRYGDDACGVGAQLLCRPDACPLNIYDLMLQCWSADSSQRPTFYQLHTFLRHANLHYQPVAPERI